MDSYEEFFMHSVLPIHSIFPNLNPMSDILIFFKSDFYFFLAKTAIIERDSLFWHRRPKKGRLLLVYVHVHIFF